MSDAPLPRPGLLRRRLATASPAVLNLYGAAAAFATYFSMYAFRKPFAAAAYEGAWLAGDGAAAAGALQLKTVLVLSQVLGYATAKFIGIKVVSETTRRRRPWLLAATILAAEGALVLLAVLPREWKAGAMLLNGFPLGMIWGLVVQYLEGRRTSEFLLAGLSCSYILASGVVKDFGLALMQPAADQRLAILSWLPPVSEFWMPAVAGAFFLPLFMGALWLLDQLPDPTREDQLERTERKPMDAAARWAFLRRYFPGVVLLVGCYFALTAFRDFRDNYMVDILKSLDVSSASQAVVTRSEFYVTLVVLGAMASLSLVHDNRRGLFAVFMVMIVGMATIGVATYLRSTGAVDGFWWIMLLGTGSYLAYVPFNALLFDRLLAATRSVGTAVFAIYVADAVGYCGTILILLFKDLAAQNSSRVEFFTNIAHGTSAVGVATLTGSCAYFMYKTAPGQRRAEAEQA